MLQIAKACLMPIRPLAIALPLLVLLAATPPAAAALTREPSLAERYIRVRAADAAGDLATASAEMGAMMAADPTVATARRAYRQALTAGDRPLALRAARLLDQHHALPLDAPLLLVIDGVQKRDWKAARAAVDRLDEGRLFSFLSPLLRAWITLGAKDGDALHALTADTRGGGMTAAYLPEQRMLMAIAAGHPEQAAASVDKIKGPGVRIRMLIAAALLRAHDRARALTVLAGDEDVLAEARARVAAGKGLAITLDGPADGISELLTHVAVDFSQQRLAPVATALARLATFAQEDNSSAWIALSNLFGAAHNGKAALAALGHVRADDPFAADAQTLRIALLIDSGDKQGALAEALAAAQHSRTGMLEWGRVGDVYLALDRPGDAAGAYGRAIAAAGATPAQPVWPLWLQQGSALELAGDWPAAKAALEKAHALAPDQPVVLNHLGYSELSRREDVAHAAALIAQASELRPDDPAITDSLGWSEYVRGNVAKALPLLERAAAGDPGEPTINEHLGDAYWAAGRYLEARYSWRAALVTADAKDADRIRAKLDNGLTPATGAP